MGEEALKAAEAGVKAAPGSARLIALEADALTATKRIDEARAVLRAATEKIADAGLLRRWADFEDRYSEGSAGAYAARAEALRAGGAADADWRPGGGAWTAGGRTGRRQRGVPQAGRDDGLAPLRTGAGRRGSGRGDRARRFPRASVHRARTQ